MRPATPGLTLHDYNLFILLRLMSERLPWVDYLQMFLKEKCRQSDAQQSLDKLPSALCRQKQNTISIYPS